MLQNNGLHACENKIITPFCVIHYFEDLKFFRKTKIWSKIHNINSGVASSIIEGVHIHIFVFTDRKNNTFQKRLITQNTNI